ncbi:MAG TPA: FAD-dependent oxidoreductase, partial [Candidatus Acidoferrum sp.]|nr:FAD-dependent oxidoreductase [Candidatus Acidoferrum sp.]
MQRTHDMVVIGAGSAGYAAARTAKDFHCDVAMVDPGPLGGLCILRGCMPSKALIATSDAIDDVRHAGQLGIEVAPPAADMPFVARRKRALVKEFADYRIAGIEEFPLYSGPATFNSENELAVGDDVLHARTFVIATGSEITPPFLPGLQEAGYLDSDSVLELESIPKSAVVLGGGYTACELGQFLSRMGAKTTILIRSSHLLTETDDDIGDALTGYFREESIDVIDRASLQRAFLRDGKKVVAFSVDGQDREIAADEIFNALGRRPALDGLGLERAGVKYDPK